MNYYKRCHIRFNFLQMRLFEEPASVMNFQNEKKNFFFLFISNKFLVVIRYIDIIVNSLSTSFLNHLFRLHFSASAQFNKCYETLKKSIWNPYVYNVDGECLIEKVQNQYGVFFLRTKKSSTNDITCIWLRSNSFGKH